ncbi:MAG: hypothetical protein ABW360_02890 [Phenylobacterium sp.]
MRYARWVFTVAGIVGILTIAPLFFLEGVMAKATGPITHPENYYGFAGVTLAWQFVYLVIGRNPAPYRPIMLLGAFGKVLFAGSVWTLFTLGRVAISVPAIASADLVLAALFVIAWVKTRPTPSSSY